MSSREGESCNQTTHPWSGIHWLILFISNADALVQLLQVTQVISQLCSKISYNAPSVTALSVSHVSQFSVFCSSMTEAARERWTPRRTLSHSDFFNKSRNIYLHLGQYLIFRLQTLIA